jgi:hypothetical protein
MKNITLSADEHLIERARAVARTQHNTLTPRPDFEANCSKPLAKGRVGRF